MNFGIYLLGTPNGYDQFPRDYNTKLFKKISEEPGKQLKFTFHLSGNLIYFIYIYKYSDHNPNIFFGLCLVFNGVYCVNLENLFNAFNEIMEEIIYKKKFLHINNKGNLDFSIKKFVDNIDEIERIRLVFKSKIDSSIKNDFVVLDGNTAVFLKSEWPSVFPLKIHNKDEFKHEFEMEIHNYNSDLRKFYNFEQLMSILEDKIFELKENEYIDLNHIILKIIPLTNSWLGKFWYYRILGQPTLDFKIEFSNVNFENNGKDKLIAALKSILTKNYAEYYYLIDKLK